MSIENLDLDQVIRTRKALGISNTETLYENDFIKIYYGNLDGYIYIVDKTCSECKQRVCRCEGEPKYNRKCYTHIKDIAYGIIAKWEEDGNEFMEE